MPLQPPGGTLAEEIKALQRRLEELTRKVSGPHVYIQLADPEQAKRGDLWLKVADT